MQEISNLISNVGFPIVACIFMYIQQKELNRSIIELSTTLKTLESKLITTSLNKVV